MIKQLIRELQNVQDTCFADINAQPTLLQKIPVMAGWVLLVPLGILGLPYMLAAIPCRWALRKIAPCFKWVRPALAKLYWLGKWALIILAGLCLLGLIFWGFAWMVSTIGLTATLLVLILVHLVGNNIEEIIK
jgi:hypothetical protein